MAEVSGGGASGSAADAEAIIKELQPGNKKLAEASLTALCLGLRAGEVTVLTAYLEASPLCEEVFAIWDSLEGSDSGRSVGFLLELFSYILEGSFVSSARTARTKVSVAGRLLTEKLPTIVRYLSTERDVLLRACLRVLGGLNSQTASMSWQLYRAFNFENENFTRLAHRRTRTVPKDGSAPPKDVRLYYVQFALGFLRWRDPNLSSSVMCVKGFLSHIFTGLIDDPPEAVASCLTDLLEFTVKPRAIARPPKLFLFSGFALRHLCKLLNSSSMEVQQHGQDFLIALCTNRYLFRQQQTQLLLDVLLDLRPLLERQQDVILAILRAHPSLEVPFCLKFNLTLQPQSKRSARYIMDVRFLLNFLSLNAGTGRLETMTPVKHEGESVVHMAPVVGSILPRAIQKGPLTQALLQADPVLQFCALRLLGATLQRVKRLAASASWTEAQRHELLQQVQQNLPELATLLLLWQKFFRVPEGATVVDDNQSDAADEVLVAKLLNLPEEGLRPHVAFQEWCKAVEAYCCVLPASVLDLPFDFTKLFRALVTVFVPGMEPLKELQHKDVSSFDNAASWLLPGIQCVTAALQQSGRLSGAFLSRAGLGYVELLVRLRSALLREEVSGVSEIAPLVAACDATINMCCCGLGFFGSEPQLEVAVWLAQISVHPAAVPFFCHVLQLLSLKPGFVSSQFHDVYRDSTAEHNGSPNQVASQPPSLFMVAAIGELSRGDAKAPGFPAASSTAADSDTYALTCARVVKAVAVILSMPLPRELPHLLEVVDVRQPRNAGAGKGEKSPAIQALVNPRKMPEQATTSGRKAKVYSLPEIRTLMDDLLEGKRKRSAASVDGPPPDLYLLEQTCIANTKLRQDLLAKLTWDAVRGPSIVLRLLARVAALEPTLPLLADEEAIMALDPAALLPLPPARHLLALLRHHPSAALRKQLKAAARAAGRPLLALQLELQVGKARKSQKALAAFLISEAEKCEEGSSSSMPRHRLTQAKYIAEVLAMSDGALTATLSEALEKYCEGLLYEGSAEPVAAVLAALWTHASKSQEEMAVAQWQSKMARRLIEQRVQPLTPWLLVHAWRWWSHLKATQSEADTQWIKDFVADVRGGYSASCTPPDKCRRYLLLSEASGQSLLSEADPWSFRAWCTELQPWHSNTGPWTWVLEPQRRKATIDAFWFSRPLTDAIPDLGELSMTATAQATSEGDSRASAAEPYDIGYLMFFIVGQLRIQWAENGKRTSEAKSLVGPLLSSIVSGGVLELLLLCSACTSASLRCCAFEALAIVMAFVAFWDDASPYKVATRNPADKQSKLPLKELPEILRLLRSVRDGIADPGAIPAALPALTASFAAACVPILLDPGHFLYLRLGLYLLRRPHLVLGEVPLFFKLMLSGQSQSHDARLWLFQLLRRSLGKQGRHITAVPVDQVVPEDAAGQDYQDGHVEDEVAAASEDAAGLPPSMSVAIAHEERWSHRPTRDALNRRFAVQWMLTFASSQELGNFASWLEVAGVVEAVLADPEGGFAASASFGLMNWVHREASRKWLGGPRSQQSLALEALARALQALLSHSQSEESVKADAASTAELVQAGAAVEAVVAGWARVKDPSARSQASSKRMLAQFWDLAHKFALLTKAAALAAVGQGKAQGTSWPRCQTADFTAAAAQLNAILHQILRLPVLALHKGHQGGHKMSDMSSHSQSLESKELLLASLLVECTRKPAMLRRAAIGQLFMQVLVMLHMSPLSTTLQNTAVWCICCLREGGSADNDRSSKNAFGSKRLKVTQGVGGADGDEEEGNAAPDEAEAEEQLLEDPGLDAQDPRDSMGLAWPDFAMPPEAEHCILELLGRHLATSSFAAPACNRADILEIASTGGAAKDSLLRALALLPFGPDMSWRVHSLLCAALAMSASHETLSEISSESWQALPHPDLVLSCITAAEPTEVTSDERSRWALTSSALLGQLARPLELVNSLLSSSMQRSVAQRPAVFPCVFL